MEAISGNGLPLSFQEMHFNGSDKNDNQMDDCEMFAEDVALFDYHFYQSCCN